MSRRSTALEQTIFHRRLFGIVGMRKSFDGTNASQNALEALNYKQPCISLDHCIAMMSKSQHLSPYLLQITTRQNCSMSSYPA